MEYLGNLDKLFEAVCDYTWADNVGIFAQHPPDITEQLSKAVPTTKYAGFWIDAWTGKESLKRYVRANPQAKVSEVRITTSAGTIRASNEDYVQNQIAQVKVFGQLIDIMPRKRKISEYTYSPQIVILKDNALNRYGCCTYTKEFLTQELREKIDEHNTKFRGESIAIDLSFWSQIRETGDSIQANTRVSSTTRETLRDSESLRSPVVPISRLQTIPRPRIFSPTRIRPTI